MTYDELSVYGRLRKIFRCGPVSMFKVCPLGSVSHYGYRLAVRSIFECVNSIVLDELLNDLIAESVLQMGYKVDACRGG